MLVKTSTDSYTTSGGFSPIDIPPKGVGIQDTPKFLSAFIVAIEQ
jgi:hypothetical protein